MVKLSFVSLVATMVKEEKAISVGDIRTKKMMSVLAFTKVSKSS